MTRPPSARSATTPTVDAGAASRTGPAKPPAASRTRGQPSSKSASPGWSDARSAAVVRSAWATTGTARETAPRDASAAAPQGKGGPARVALRGTMTRASNASSSTRTVRVTASRSCPSRARSASSAVAGPAARTRKARPRCARRSAATTIAPSAPAAAAEADAAPSSTRGGFRFVTRATAAAIKARSASIRNARSTCGASAAATSTPAPLGIPRGTVHACARWRRTSTFAPSSSARTDVTRGRSACAAVQRRTW